MCKSLWKVLVTLKYKQTVLKHAGGLVSASDFQKWKHFLKNVNSFEMCKCVDFKSANVFKLLEVREAWKVQALWKNV